MLPVWFMAVIASAAVGWVGMFVAWTFKSDRTAAVRDERINRLVNLLEKYDPTVLRADVDRLKEDVDELERGHQRNRDRIAEAYKDLGGNGHRDPTRPG